MTNLLKWGAVALLCFMVVPGHASVRLKSAECDRQKMGTRYRAELASTERELVKAKVEVQYYYYQDQRWYEWDKKVKWYSAKPGSSRQITLNSRQMPSLGKVKCRAWISALKS